MTTYLVSLPVTAYFAVEIEAESPEAAIEKALVESNNWDIADVEAWDAHKSVINEDHESVVLLDEAEAVEVESVDLDNGETVTVEKAE